MRAILERVTTSRADLPVIDVSSLSTPSNIEAIGAAAHDHGFFYVEGYGIPTDTEQHLIALARQFFARPLEEKLAIENVHSAQFRGYTRVGQERTGGVSDGREQLDVGRERAQPTSASPLYSRLRGPNQWPAAVPELRPALLSWIDRLDGVSIQILRALAISLGQPADAFDSAFLPESDTFAIRYPSDGAADAVLGVGAHKDYGFLALLLQDEAGGLEVDDGEGGFLPVPPRPGTMVANLGEMLEIATHGTLTATVHRVVRPRVGDRISLAHFFSPRLEATLSPLDIRGSSAGVDENIHAEFGVNALRGWARSHPEVARRHYPELG